MKKLLFILFALSSFCALAQKKAVYELYCQDTVIVTQRKGLTIRECRQGVYLKNPFAKDEFLYAPVSGSSENGTITLEGVKGNSASFSIMNTQMSINSVFDLIKNCPEGEAGGCTTDCDPDNECLISAILENDTLKITDKCGTQMVDLGQLTNGAGGNISITTNGNGDHIITHTNSDNSTNSITLTSFCNTIFGLTSAVPIDNQYIPVLDGSTRECARIRLGDIDFSDDDSDPTNEIELPIGGLNGDILETDGNGIYTWTTPSVFSDTDDQGLAFTNPTVTVTTDANYNHTVTLPPSVYVDNVDDADADPNNECLVSGSVTGNTLNIIDGCGNIDIDVAAFYDNVTTNITDLDNNCVNTTVTGSDATGFVVSSEAIINPNVPNMFQCTDDGYLVGNCTASAQVDWFNLDGELVLLGYVQAFNTDCDIILDATITDADGTTVGVSETVSYGFPFTVAGITGAASPIGFQIAANTLTTTPVSANVTIRYSCPTDSGCPPQNVIFENSPGLAPSVCPDTDCGFVNLANFGIDNLSDISLIITTIDQYLTDNPLCGKGTKFFFNNCAQYQSVDFNFLLDYSSYEFTNTGWVYAPPLFPPMLTEGIGTPIVTGTWTNIEPLTLADMEQNMNDFLVLLNASPYGVNWTGEIQGFQYPTFPTTPSVGDVVNIEFDYIFNVIANDALNGIEPVRQMNFAAASGLNCSTIQTYEWVITETCGISQTKHGFDDTATINPDGTTTLNINGVDYDVCSAPCSAPCSGVNGGTFALASDPNDGQAIQAEIVQHMNDNPTHGIGTVFTSDRCAKLQWAGNFATNWRPTVYHWNGTEWQTWGAASFVLDQSVPNMNNLITVTKPFVYPSNLSEVEANYDALILALNSSSVGGNWTYEIINYTPVNFPSSPTIGQDVSASLEVNIFATDGAFIDEPNSLFVLGSDNYQQSTPFITNGIINPSIAYNSLSCLLKEDLEWVVSNNCSITQTKHGFDDTATINPDGTITINMNGVDYDVCSAPCGGVVSLPIVSNGLTDVGNDFELGGFLEHDTEVDLGVHDMEFKTTNASLTSLFSIGMTDNATKSTGMTVTREDFEIKSFQPSTSNEASVFVNPFVSSIGTKFTGTTEGTSAYFLPQEFGVSYTDAGGNVTGIEFIGDDFKILGIPVYGSTSLAAADVNLPAETMFKVSNGDGTSSLHLKD